MTSSTFSFSVQATDGDARLGEITTRRGTIATPVFMPVGTAAAVKALAIDQLEALGPEIILCNTYHLMLRPGVELLESFGGVHDFMAWNRPLLSDSGGFQVFSLSSIRKVKEEGVEFRSHLDGSSHFLSPERSIEIQSRMGVDIAMAFDECPSYDFDRQQVAKSMDRTHRWAERSLRAHDPDRGALFGIVQGGVFPDLRSQSVEAIASMDFDGCAIGGLSVGEPKEEMRDIVASTTRRLPAEKPRYLMGVGTPEDLVESVAQGVDMFDCVMPTRNARNGSLFTSDGRISIKNARFRDDHGPIDSECGCLACRRISRAYLRHLYVSGEIAAAVYSTIHNLSFYLDLMRRIRQAIASHSFGSFREGFLARYAGSGTERDSLEELRGDPLRSTDG